MPSYHLRDPPEPFPSSGPENGSCNRTPRAPPYKSITSSPLNPSLPSGPPAFDILSPFARAGPHSAPRIKRIPSEESRALSITPPFASNPSRPRGSMILYRTADAQDDHRAPDAQDLLAPPLAYKRNSIGSVDSAVSLWSDSKYPVGTASERRGLVAYAWDPLEDDNEPNDEDDLLHDPAGKMMHDSGRPMSLRGIVNFTAIILLLCALLSLFVVYPVYSFYHSNGLEALIVGNTRINSTGQASSAPFDPRSQIPLTSLTAWIDPATPQDVLTRTGKDGVMYDIVFSDEFNIDDRSFYEDADPVWEAADDQLHDPRLVTTRNGYLILESRNVPLGGRSKGVAAHLSGLLHQRTAVCLHGGFVEIAVASPSSSGDEHFVRMGVWDAEVDDASLSATSLLQLAIDPAFSASVWGHAEPIPKLNSYDQHFFSHNFDSEPLSVGRLWRFDVKQGSEPFEELLSLANEHDLDLWQIAPSHVDVYFPGSALVPPPPLLNLPYTLVANISAPEVRSSSAEWDLKSLQNTTFHDEYHPLFEINNFIQELARLNPGLVSVKDLGHSGMGREMKSIVISSTQGESIEGHVGKRRKHKHFDDDLKLAFVIVGAQHAREWIATATSLYLAHALVSNSSEPHSLSHLLDVFDFYIIPTPNPDGYEFTWENDRFWYKNRQQMSPKSTCVGLDMNRNWGYKWKPRSEEMIPNTNTKKPSGPVDPCSHWYPGHRPFEAPETNNIANMVITIPNLAAFLDLRSYGQMLSSPFSYSCRAIPKDAEDQLEAGLGAARAMSLVHGTSVTTGSLCSMLYRAPGNIVDWMYKRAGIKYSYALHLRDTGTYGFVLPARWIRPVGEETTGMLGYLSQFIAKKMDRE
ncbi:hypothetical protein C0991_005301 [Blastosporella zonata]|nr:hypothetical protein C0991_005301 [Blastosporella zonata]